LPVVEVAGPAVSLLPRSRPQGRRLSCTCTWTVLLLPAAQLLGVEVELERISGDFSFVSFISSPVSNAILFLLITVLSI
jgi:hypothetical protein